MRAIVLDRPGSFRVAEVPDPTPGEGQIVVKVDACGICGTDIHIMDGEFPPTPYPRCGEPPAGCLGGWAVTAP